MSEFDWRRSITFSDRLSQTSKIAAAYKNANPSCQATEASQYAKSNEETARRTALSLTEYHDICAKAVQLLLSQAESQSLLPDEDRHVDEHIFPNLPSNGARIGKYTNAHHFKDGLFSEVFRAADPETRAQNRPKIVALKITSPGMEQPPHDSKREARILEYAKCEHVIPLTETFQHSGNHLVLAFPYMPYDLSIVLHERRLTPLSRGSVLRDILLGLAHLHKLEIIHRDIKPSNILLASPAGPAYIADFGIAWAAAESASEPRDEKILDVGTTCYRPPELLFGNQMYGTELDMWAFGCVAAQVLSLNATTLFDAGDLGSELALIKSIFETLGTPDLKVWPEAANMPDWGKMNFAQYPSKLWKDILPGADECARDFVSSLVVYESASRLNAKEALKHPCVQQNQ